MFCLGFGIEKGTRTTDTGIESLTLFMELPLPDTSLPGKGDRLPSSFKIRGLLIRAYRCQEFRRTERTKLIFQRPLPVH